MDKKDDKGKIEGKEERSPSPDLSIPNKSPEGNKRSFFEKKKEIAKPKQEKSERNTPKERHSTAGSIAIFISIILSSGLAYQIFLNDKQSQNPISALQIQVAQAESQLVQQLDDATSQLKVDTGEVQKVVGLQQQELKGLGILVSELKNRTPNDWLLAEAEYLVKLAGRKLYLEHDITVAIQLLETADQRTSILNDPTLLPLRKSMAQDIVSLKALPKIDTDRLVLNLITLQEQVDTLPLNNAHEVDAKIEQEKALPSENIHDWKSNLKIAYTDFVDDFITIRKHSGTAVPMLTIAEEFYLRENIKAKLESAIQAIYREQGEIYQASLEIAGQWATNHFYQPAPVVKEFIASVEQLSSETVSTTYPAKLKTESELSSIVELRLRKQTNKVEKKEEPDKKAKEEVNK